MNKVLFLVLNLLFLATACDDDPTTTLQDVNIVAQGDCTVATMSGLSATLCITDVAGNPQDLFDQNENFIISLTFQNDSAELVKIKEEYLANEGVLTVMSNESDESFGKPFTSASCQFDGNPYMEIPPGESYVVSSPWVLQEGVSIIGPICKSNSNEYLATGSYRVVVTLDFVMEMGGESINVEGGNALSIEFNIM
ncbi:hypothetical protein [Poritiphilus flavus]|uniref:Uncharacterized protein n=1 Tax=Poritiphilus flavus TaxID=2697053 RepID=A0A6L9EFN4_9FLAO|nr:hypothetical protein [Poritiphilus flavus]NAS13575.1 hypothetical protein [Poritiphilus flavus]